MEKRTSISTTTITSTNSGIALISLVISLVKTVKKAKVGSRRFRTLEDKSSAQVAHVVSSETMTKVLRTISRALVDETMLGKRFGYQSPGNRVVATKVKIVNIKYQSRLDTGEVIDGRKWLYLKINFKATGQGRKADDWKLTSRAKLAKGWIDINTPLDQLVVLSTYSASIQTGFFCNDIRASSCGIHSSHEQRDSALYLNQKP